MLISDHFNLGRKQAALDFVDVDTINDLAVFIDPRALRLLRSDWAANCVTLIQSFFQAVLDAIKADDLACAKRLLTPLREPRETRLGLSRAGNAGRAMGPGLADLVMGALDKSRAIETGLLRDLEDTILMVDGISHDIVSDIATNLLRRPLIEYTQGCCNTYGIPMDDQVDSGAIFHPEIGEWENEFVRLPSVNEKKLLLVPKAIVRHKMEYNVGEYYKKYILENLRQAELSNPTSELVKVVKSTKERKVTSKKLMEKYGGGKDLILDVTTKSPELLTQYRNDKAGTPAPIISNEELIATEGAPPTNWDELFGDVQRITPGAAGADAYEKAVEALLTALFYPYLTRPERQARLHGGRKRVDITYDNCSRQGFFNWLGLNYRSALLFVECKNYSGDVGNPELDQLSGRFSPSRGQVGLLVVRTFDDKPKFLAGCRDTAQDGRGFIIALDDGDLHELVEIRKGSGSADFELLRRRFGGLIN